MTIAGLKTVGLKMRRAAVVAVLALAVCGVPRDAAAQLDPLLFLKRSGASGNPTGPNVLLVVDTSERMKLDAAGDPTADADTRISVARSALTEAVAENKAYGSPDWSALRFGLIPMQQIGAPSGVIQPTDYAKSIRDGLAALTPVVTDAGHTVDAPVNKMLIDASTLAGALAAGDTECRNTIVVLVVGGGEVVSPIEDAVAMGTQLGTTANLFLNIGANHRVPIYVIAIAPPAADVAALQSIAANSGGVYTEISAEMIANAGASGRPVPEVVRAVNLAVQHGFAAQADVDTDPTGALPIGPSTEFQVTSPIIGTVNLEGALDITGAGLVNDLVENPTTHVKIPQRSNLMVTSGFVLPGPGVALPGSVVASGKSSGFEASLRGFRVYKPVVDDTKSSGFRFDADGTRLWVASVPDEASRNIYTALPDGTVVKFDAGNAATLAPYLNTADNADAERLIAFIRNQPLGAIVDSTPAVMDAPSLDPPPDVDYPAFADANKNRRTVVWIGANDGMLHAIDGRLGKEVWAFIPFNLLPKLIALRSGQPVGDFRFFVDGSPKVADVKVDGAWHTYLIMGEGPGGTFYQAFDVTLKDMADTVSTTTNTLSTVLGYFASTTSVPLAWAFPRYSVFDTRPGAGSSDPAVIAALPWGDVAIASGASAPELGVGETWSDPAVGQIENTAGPYAVLTGSGFFKWSLQQLPNRGGAVAGSTFYLLDATTGTVISSRNVSDDAHAETVDNCATAPAPPHPGDPIGHGDCTFEKNALQADPVATGPPDSRFITKAYIGDIDGKVWKFNISLDDAHVPQVAASIKLYDSQALPMFASMATVNVGGAKQYLFQATGSDLLPSPGVTASFKLAVVLDNGATGANTASIFLEKTDNVAGDEKVTSFPAVAGDIVFFSTTTFYPQSPCTPPDANLYAFTFVGGPAYDTNGDGTVTKKGDSVKVRTTVGARASAPFIVDQHLVYSVGNKIELFGDPQDFNNGVGQAGVRILSWREVR